MSFRRLLSTWGVDEALRQHPGLSISPDESAALVLAGTVVLNASAPGLEAISDSYQLSITIPKEFPRAYPRVRDIGHRIPRQYHRLTDGSFCLGSPVRLRLLLADAPTIAGFIDKCVIPYLYGYSYFEKHGRMPFGELAHGERGIIEDYQRLLHVSSIEGCASMLLLIGQKRRLANKQPCSCGSGIRLGRCHNRTANRMRIKLGRHWCRREAKWLIDDYTERSAANIAQALLNQMPPPRRNLKEAERNVASISSEDAINEKAVA